MNSSACRPFLVFGCRLIPYFVHAVASVTHLTGAKLFDTHAAPAHVCCYFTNVAAWTTTR
jgi:hypothetical protein